MDRYSDALPLYEQALAIRENELGPNHPDTANSLNSLAELYKAVEYYEEALRLYERALVIRASELGESHPDTALSLSGLASLYAAMEQDVAAEAMYIRALSILSSSLSEDHPTTHLEATNFRIFVQQVIQKGDDKKLSDHPLTQKTLRTLLEGKSQENMSL